MYTAHYPIMGGGSAAIDSVWQLHPWLTGVIRRVGLTDKMADKAGDKLPNQKSGERVGSVRFEVHCKPPADVQTAEYSMHLASSAWQVLKSIFQVMEGKNLLGACTEGGLDTFICTQKYTLQNIKW